jgi:hypothetical protein
MEFHKDVYEKIGFGPENIKIIENFISQEQCQNLINLVKDTESVPRPVQMGPDGTPITYLHKYERSTSIAEQYVNRVKSILDESYKVETKFRHAIIKRWEHLGNSPISIDDLGATDHNNMYACVYLNDNYEGGELAFPSQSSFFKPSPGDLIMFPGNANYRYVVRDVLGSRYVMPIWFDFA